MAFFHCELFGLAWVCPRVLCLAHTPYACSALVHRFQFNKMRFGVSFCMVSYGVSELKQCQSTTIENTKRHLTFFLKYFIPKTKSKSSSPEFQTICISVSLFLNNSLTDLHDGSNHSPSCPEEGGCSPELSSTTHKGKITTISHVKKKINFWNYLMKYFLFGIFYRW